MAKFCPEWVFSACVAKAAGGFLTGNAPLSSISNNIISELNLDSIESKVLGSVDDPDKVFSILFQYKSKVLSG